MLIKYYGYIPESPPSSPDLFIIEDVTNLIVHGGIFNAFETGPDISVVQINLFYDKDAQIKAEEPFKKLISFVKNGEVNRLAVFGTAYVCNNDGETIEKVSIS